MVCTAQMIVQYAILLFVSLTLNRCFTELPFFPQYMKQTAVSFHSATGWGVFNYITSQLAVPIGQNEL